MSLVSQCRNCCISWHFNAHDIPHQGACTIDRLRPYTKECLPQPDGHIQAGHGEQRARLCCVLQANSQKKKSDGGLLERADRQELLHPLLKHELRRSHYPTDSSLINCLLTYAGVKSLSQFKKKYAPDFRGRGVALPPVLKALKSQVGYVMHRAVCIKVPLFSLQHSAYLD